MIEFICRHCERPIERSPATGLWWPIDNVPPWLGHEPQEPQQDGHEDDGDPATIAGLVSGTGLWLLFRHGAERLTAIREAGYAAWDARDGEGR